MSKSELIELKDLTLNDPIELAAPAAPPAPAAPASVSAGQPSVRAVYLSGENVSVQGAVCETGGAGVGHHFQPCSQAHPAWCDLCGEFIWGLYKRCLRCSSEYVLH